MHVASVDDEVIPATSAQSMRPKRSNAGSLVDGASFACVSRVEMCDMLSVSGSSESLYASLMLKTKSELSMDAVSSGSILLESLLLGDSSAYEDPVETLSSSLI